MPARWGATIGVAAVGMLAIYVLLSPLSVVFHRLVPTPARLLVWAIGTVLIAPFFLAAESLIRARQPPRRDRVGRGQQDRDAGRDLHRRPVGFLPGVIMLILPILALLYIMVEVFAAGVYSRNRNVAVIAFVEAAFIAWLASVGNAMV